MLTGPVHGHQAHGEDAGWIQPVRRLVEDEHRRLVHQRTEREPEPLPVAERQSGGTTSEQVGDSHRQRLPSPRPSGPRLAGPREAEDHRFSATVSSPYAAGTSIT